MSPRCYPLRPLRPRLRRPEAHSSGHGTCNGNASLMPMGVQRNRWVTSRSGRRLSWKATAFRKSASVRRLGLLSPVSPMAPPTPPMRRPPISVASPYGPRSASSTRQLAWRQNDARSARFPPMLSWLPRTPTTQAVRSANARQTARTSPRPPSFAGFSRQYRSPARTTPILDSGGVLPSLESNSSSSATTSPARRFLLVSVSLPCRSEVRKSASTSQGRRSTKPR
jgi:hypothetical protein